MGGLGGRWGGGGLTGAKCMDETISGCSAEALKEKCRHNTDWRGAAAVLIAVPVSMEGLLCLLPDLLRHVCLETQVSFLTGLLSFTGRTT